MTMMTTADRHYLEGREALELHGPCPHGRPQGFSNYDVPFCGDCEAEDYYAWVGEELTAEIDARLAAGDPTPYDIPAGPIREGDLAHSWADRAALYGDGRPARDDLPF